MHKTLLKLLIYEILERIARFETLLVEVERDSETLSPGLTSGIRKRLDVLKLDILSDKAFLNHLFSEKTIKEKEFRAKLEPMVLEPYHALCGLTQLLNSILKGVGRPEARFFLQDAMPAKLSADAGRLAVVFTAEGATNQSSEWHLDEVLVESVSILQKNNPLGWVGLTRAFANRLQQTSPSLESLRPQMKGPFSDAGMFRALGIHALNLRLLGPAYYYNSVIDALLAQDGFFLRQIEPALFYGLNHLNYTDKSLVILHEATEKAREMMGEINANGFKDVPPLNKDQAGEVFRQVEKIISARYAFSEKNFRRSLQLQDRLAQGILLSASNLYPLEEVLADYEAAQAWGGPEPKKGVPSIYDVLTRVMEEPNTPREIVNAGWIHKMERSSVWLYNTYTGNGGGDSAQGFERLVELIDRQDHLLLKSIETSEIHRGLLCAT